MISIGGQALKSKSINQYVFELYLLYPMTDNKNSDVLDDDWGFVHPDDPSKVLDQAKLDIANMKPIVDELDAMSNEELMQDSIRSGEKAIRRIERVQEHVAEAIESMESNDDSGVASRNDVYIRAYADLVSASVALQMTGPREVVNDVNEAKNTIRELIEETDS